MAHTSGDDPVVLFVFPYTVKCSGSSVQSPCAGTGLCACLGMGTHLVWWVGASGKWKLFKCGGFSRLLVPRLKGLNATRIWLCDVWSLWACHSAIGVWHLPLYLGMAVPFVFEWYVFVGRF